MLSTIALVLLLVVIFVRWYKVHRFNSYLKHLPGPKPLPILGNALDLGGTDQLLYKLELVREAFPEQLIRVTIGPDYSDIITLEYKFLETVFNSTKIIEKSVEYYNLRKWLGTGLLTSSGEKWKIRRRLITPSFHFQILENFIDVFHSACNILVEKLKPEIGKESFNVYSYITLCTLDIICESAMGIKINAQDNKNPEYVKSVKEIGRIIMERSMHPFKHFEIFYVLSRDFWKEKAALKVLHRTTDEVIKKRREQLIVERNQRTQLNTKCTNCGESTNNVECTIGANFNKEKLEHEDVTGKCVNLKEDMNVCDDHRNENDPYFPEKKKFAFLDMLLQATTSDGESLTNADIREEVDTFMFEGHDTTASGISFTLYLLSKHPEIQKHVYEEIIEILGNDKQKAPTYRDLQNMKYLEKVILESLRLFLPVPAIGRKLLEDLEHDGYVYPKGLEMLIPLYTFHRNPEYFPDPEKFDPERFSLENRTGRKSFAFIPFSAGVRNCIGQRFAMLELKSTISKVLRHYELVDVEKYEPILLMETTLKSKNGILIGIKNRFEK